MDPALNSIIGPWSQLGIVGSVVLALGVALVWCVRALIAAHKAHLAAVEACGTKNLDMLEKKIESDNALANALERISDRIPK